MNVPFLLAPMAEISHRALRELIESFGGCDEYFTEMISAPALLGGGPFEKWYTDNGPCPEKVVFQLVGADIGQISKAAALLDKLECRGIDINMGCSAPLIRKTGAGVAWMASPSTEGAIDRAGELIKAVRKAVKHRLSVKMRIGFTDDFDYLVNFCRRLAEEGVELIILHPRTAKEKFKRTARWGYISALRQELRIPVAGNGDIANAEGLIARANAIAGTGAAICDAVMVGRAAVKQPWIFAHARKMAADNGLSSYKAAPDTMQKSILKRSGDEGCPQKTMACEARHFFADRPPNAFFKHTFLNLEETGLRFLELLSRYQPPEFHISRARRFFGFFCDNLKWGNYVKNQLNREKTLSGMERVWKECFTRQ